MMPTSSKKVPNAHYKVPDVHTVLKLYSRCLTAEKVLKSDGTV